MRAPAIDVAVSIVRAADGRVLMAERTARQLSAGFWELPGGKIDPGESAAQAAARELDEEVGIRPQALRPWIRYEHCFPTRRIRLHFFRVERWEGTPHGREGQRLAWVDPAAPAVAPILPSVERALTALALPPIYAVCDPAALGGPMGLLARLAVALRAGLRLIQLRAPGLAVDQRIALARRAGTLAAAHGARVVLAGTTLEARRAGLEAVHSTGADVKRLCARPPVKLWIVSCHAADDLDRAVALGADAAVVSPVLPTPAHPGWPALGWDGVGRLAATAPIPLYVQGGLTPADLSRARASGATGVATSQWVRDDGGVACRHPLPA